MRRAGMVLGVAVVWAALLLVGLSRVDRVVRATAPATRAVPEAERRELLGVVQRFNEIWSDFYASGGIPTMIDAMPASKMVKHGIFRDTGFLAGNGRYQVYDLARMVPLEATSTARDRAELLVYEEWNYVYQDRATRSPVTEVKGMGQGFRYVLERQGGSWVIQAWTPEDVATPDPEGFVW